jgi:very-short-patch-repair endonuclease
MAHVNSAAAEPARSSPLEAGPVRSRLDLARKELLDFSLRNTLLNWRPSRARGAEIAGGDADEIVKALVEAKTLIRFVASEQEEAEERRGSDGAKREIASGSRATVRPLASEELLPTNLTPESLQKRLLATWYAAHTHIEERGFNVLYLAVGMLEWYESDSSEKPLLAPLILVPVELERHTAAERFRLKWNGEDVEQNLSLIEKLKTDFGVTIPELPDVEDLVPTEYFETVAEAVRGLPRWKIHPERIALGFFSFSKLLMYRDLDPAGWAGEGSGRGAPVLASILTEGFPEPDLKFEETDRVDSLLPVRESSQVVDADSSQLLAILEARAGRHLVIQGPPGTGKSQTITNLIADALDRGKKVLFVAEKMAALEVVKRRLDSLHLGDACLELHSHTANKKAILDELRRTSELARPKLDEFSDRLRLLERATSQLNGFADAINDPIGSTRWTPYQLIGELVRLRPTLQDVTLPEFSFPGAAESQSQQTSAIALSTGMLEWGRADFIERMPLVQSTQTLLAAMGRPCDHPYAGSRLRAVLPTDKDLISRAAAQALVAVRQLDGALDSLGAFMGLPFRRERREAAVLCSAGRRALSAPHLQGIELRTSDWQSRRDELRSVIAAGKAHSALHARFAVALIPAAWQQDLLPARQVLATTGTKWWRALSGEYRAVRRNVLGLFRAPPKGISVSNLLTTVDAIMEAQGHRKVIDEHSGLASRLFGVQWQGEHSDWDVLERISQWTVGLYRDIGDGKVPAGIVDFLSGTPALDSLKETIEQVEAALPTHEEKLARVFDLLDWDPAARQRISDRGELPAQESMLEAMMQGVDRLDQQARFNVYVGELNKADLSWLVRLAHEWPNAGTHLSAAFQQAYCEALLRRAMRERPALQGFDGATQDGLVGQFRELDRQLLVHNRIRLAAKHWQSVPRLSGDGQSGILLREFSKRTRHLPIRKLMSRAGFAIQATKPVMMMSPMSVAAFLAPGSMHFDLIVFDEASQVRPVEAFGAILRGDQLVVVGDSRQLPPTSFFDSLTADGPDADSEDDEEENVSADMESILGLAVGRGMPQRMLRWHYRSRHESLIAVSNKEFYDNRLVVFPSPDAGRTELGLRFRHLPQTAYDRGKTRTNPGEAKAVAAAVLEHARTRPARTLGVASFSLAQAQAILDELELLRKQNPDLESFFSDHSDEPFFVKNLESVQGDERDVILISVGYGRTADGYLAMSFGPLNGDGGERRLNVLISRARRRCEVFTNLTHDDIDLSRTSARGVAALKTFLKYAQTGILDVPDVGSGDADSVFEEEVAAAIERSGHVVAKQVGSAGFRIDLAVKDPARPGRYLLAIECDGASYHSSRSARDRDRLRQQVLEGLGWRFHRIWSTDWFKSPESELRKTLAAIDAARATRTAPDPEPPPPPMREGVLIREPVEPRSDAPPTTPYQMASLSIALGGLDLHLVPKGRISEWICAVVQVESPVHIDEVSRRIAVAAGVQRIGSRIQTALQNAVEYAVRAGQVRRTGEFLWLTGMQKPAVRDRSDFPPSSKRIGYVCDEEIAEATQEVIEAAHAVNLDEVPPAVGRILGFGRVTEDMRSAIGRVVTQLVKAGDLESSNGQITLGRSSRG